MSRKGSPTGWLQVALVATSTRRASGALGELLARRWPVSVLTLGAVLLPLSFWPELNDQFDLAKVTVLRALFAAFLPFLIWRRAKLAGSLPKAFNLSILALLATHLVATVASVDPFTSFLGEYTRHQGFTTLVIYVGFCYGAAVGLQSPGQIRAFLVAVSVAGALVAMYGIIQILGLDWITWTRPSGRISSTIGQPNLLAGYLVMVLPLTLWLLGENTYGLRDLWLAAAGAMLLTIMLSLSRAGWLSLLATGVTFLLLMWGTGLWRVSLRRWRVPTVIVLTLVVLAASLPEARSLLSPLYERVFSAADLAAPPIAGRLDLWRSAALMARDNLVTGVGPEAFGHSFPQYRSETFARTEGLNVLPLKAHSIPLHVVATTGVPGGLAYGAVLSSYAFHVRRRLRGSGRRSDSLLLAALASSFVGYSVQGLFGFSNVALDWLFWVLMGTALGQLGLSLRGDPQAACPFPTTGEDEAARSVDSNQMLRRVPLVGGAVFLILAGLSLSLLPLRADGSYKAGLREEASEKYGVAADYYQRAISLMPSVTEYRLRLGRAYEFLAAENNSEAEFLVLAEATYRESLRLRPRDPYANLHRARVGFTRARLGGGRVEPALAQAEEAARIDPNNPVIRTAVAQLYLEAGRLSVAERHLSAALELAPYEESHVALGHVYVRQQKYTSAINEFEAATLLAYRARNFAFLGKALFGAGRINDALSAFETALGIDPGNVDARLGLALGYWTLNAFEEAQREYLAVLQLDPGNEEALESLVQIAALLGEPSSAP